MTIPTRTSTNQYPTAVLNGLQSQQQHTLHTGFERSGPGLHTGQITQVRVLPAPPGQGRYFVRVDLENNPQIPAQLGAVDQTLLSTELKQGAAKVRTVEHLLAALVGLGVDNARIEINGPEVPLLDGSAREWVNAVLEAGLAPLGAPRPHWLPTQPVVVQDGEAFVLALPAAATQLSYGIEFDHLPAIGRQWHSFRLLEFAQEIASARTFGFADQIEQLRAQGLIKGGSLENALVCGPQGWLNPPLRFPNEPVRHKLLDLVGDLSLLGTIPQAHFLAYKASHRLHTQLAAQLVQCCQLAEGTASC